MPPTGPEAIQPNTIAAPDLQSVAHAEPGIQSDIDHTEPPLYQEAEHQVESALPTGDITEAMNAAVEHIEPTDRLAEIIDEVPGIPSSPEQTDSTGHQLIGRGGNVLTKGWTEDPTRPGVITRPVDYSNPDDAALAAKLTAQADQFTAMSAAASAEAQARNAQIDAAQAASNQPVPGGINGTPFSTPAAEVAPAPAAPIIDKVPTSEELGMLRTQGTRPTPEA